jgi:hypothetical protein
MTPKIHVIWHYENSPKVHHGQILTIFPKKSSYKSERTFGIIEEMVILSIDR